MALRSEELPGRLQSLSGLLTSHEAAQFLQMTYWHFMHLVEAGRIPGLRVVDRWLFSPEDLESYRRSRVGDLEDACREALDNPDVALTEKQEAICRRVLAGRRPSEIARELHQSRQAVHAQLGLIRDKLAPTDAGKPDASDAQAHASRRRSWKSPSPSPSPST
jgi:DNA-binding CsgD family transcriptional regulator